MVLNTITQQKLKFYYSRKRCGDHLSASLALFDLVSIASVVEKKKLVDIERLNYCWEISHGYVVKNVARQTEKIIAARKRVTKEETTQEEFGKKFRDLYNSDPTIQKSKKILQNFIDETQPLLAKFLNKEQKKAKKRISAGLKGGVGISSIDFELL